MGAGYLPLKPAKLAAALPVCECTRICCECISKLFCTYQGCNSMCAIVFGWSYINNFNLISNFKIMRKFSYNCDNI